MQCHTVCEDCGPVAQQGDLHAAMGLGDGDGASRHMPMGTTMAVWELPRAVRGRLEPQNGSSNGENGPSRAWAAIREQLPVAEILIVPRRPVGFVRRHCRHARGQLDRRESRLPPRFADRIFLLTKRPRKVMIDFCNRSLSAKMVLPITRPACGLRISTSWWLSQARSETAPRPSGNGKEDGVSKRPSCNRRQLVFQHH